MKGYLLDTNCISELVSSRPERGVLEWLEGTEEQFLFLSVLTLGEIRKGIAGLSPGRRRAQLDAWLERELPARFSGRILPIDGAVADRWGVLTAEARRKGKPLGTIDGLLAATALEHSLTLVTHNVGDFAQTRAVLLSPWDDR